MDSLTPNSYQKQKPQSLNVRKIGNGYVVAPQGLFSNNLNNVETYIENLADVPAVLEQLFNTEM